MYHHVGASLYFFMSFMRISGFSVVLLWYCFQICLRLCRYVYTIRDEIAAKDSPYDMAKVVLPISTGKTPHEPHIPDE